MVHDSWSNRYWNSIHRYTDWYNESMEHGWPSFRDAEVVWENVRCIKYTGETVSITGAHLG